MADPRPGTILKSFDALGERPRAVACHPDGRSVLVVSEREVAVWWAPSGERRFGAAAPDGVAGVAAWAEEGRSVVYATGGRLRRLDEEGARTLDLQGVDQLLAASPDGAVALAHSGRVLWLLDLRTLERVPSVRVAHPDTGARFDTGALSAGGKVALTARTVGAPPNLTKLELRRLEDGAAFRHLNVGAPAKFALSANGKWLLWTDARSTAPVAFDVQKSRMEVRLLPPVRTPVSVIAFGPGDARHFLYAGGSRVEIWDRLAERHAASLQHPETAGRAWDVAAAAFTHDGRRVVSATADGRLFVWDVL